jgi:hypothetical protein
MDNTAERHLVSVVDDPVDGMYLAAGLERLQRRHIFGHCNHMSTGHLTDQRVAFLMIDMGVVPEQDLDVGKFETQLCDGFLDDGNIAF